MLCQKCKKDRVERSHRHGPIEHFVSFAGYYPYRCKDCHTRFLAFQRWWSEPANKRPSGVEREIKATRGAMKAKRKRREMFLYGIAVALFLAFLYFVTRDRGDSTQGRSVPPVPCLCASPSAPVAA